MSRPANDERLLNKSHAEQRQLPAPRAAAGDSLYRRQLRVEPLEDRRLLATITVDTLVDGTGVPGTSLREAIIAAASGDTINFAASLTSGGPATINLISTGQLTINKNLTITGPGANLLTIRAYDVNTGTFGNGTRVFNVDDGTSTNRTVAIAGLTLTGGDASGDGGAIRSLENLTITNSIISGNRATGNGGGIFNSNRNLALSGTTVDGNRARYGGGIHCVNGTLIITSSTISNNLATYDDGGGIYSSACPITLTSSTISGNSAPGDGGGIFADVTTLNITASTISGNSAMTGGGIRNDEGTLNLTNSTISGNLAKTDGGGLYFYKGDVTAIHSTITANKADSDNNGSGVGGGVRTVTTGIEAFRHTILAGNIRGAAATRSDASGPIELQYSLIGDNTGATVNNVSGNQIGTGAAPINPLLGPLANNGGPTLTHNLLAGSPAIDTGNAAAVPGSGGVPTFDQRGTPFGRKTDGDNVGGARIDIGAIELQFTNTSPTNPAAVPLAAINEDVVSASNSGTLVSAIVTASGSTDADGNTLGIAVTAVDNAHGDWEFSTNGGSNWQDLSPVSATSARLLAPAHLVRFVPDANFNSQIASSPTISFKVWDQTSGTAGSTADTTSNSAYSASAAQATQSVTAVNDAPSFSLSASSVQRNEDAGAVTVNNFATNMARGPATATDETSQTLTFLVSVTGTTGNLAFSSAPAIDATTGALTFTTSANTNGTATVEVSLQDNGSGTSPNVNTSAVQSFTIQIAAVNDEQVLATNNLLTLARGASAAITYSFLETTDIDNTPAQLVYTITSGPTNGTVRVSGSPVTQFTQQQINAGDVSYEHNGTATVSDSFGFTVDDGAGTSSSGTFQISVQPFAGDYNGNQVVDASDYVLFRKTFGASGVPAYSGADGDGNTAIGSGDYTVWQANFGNSMPPGSGSVAVLVLSTGQAPPSAAASDPDDIVAGATTSSDVTNSPARNQGRLVGASLSKVAVPSDSISNDVLLAWLSSTATNERPEGGDALGHSDNDQRADSDTGATLDLLDAAFASLDV